MKRAFVLVVAAWAAALAGSLWGDAEGKYKNMPAGTFDLKSKSGVEYVLAVPQGYSAANGAPFMLCLHGDGIVDAADNARVWAGWVNAAAQQSFVVCAPKSPGQNWVGAGKVLFELIGEIERTYRLRTREYAAVGHSSGASAACETALADTMRFSAFGSMGGRFRIDQERVKKAGNLGAYVFHFSGDPVVPVQFGKDAAGQLKAAGATVEYDEQAMNSHALEHYLAAASAPMTAWISGWVRKNARILSDPGDDRCLAWEDVSSLDYKLKAQMKPGLVYLFSSGDKENSTAQWLRWDVFPQPEFRDAAKGFVCVKLDYSGEQHKELVKELKVKSCALLVIDAGKKVLKKWTRQTTLEKLLKELSDSAQQAKKGK